MIPSRSRPAMLGALAGLCLWTCLAGCRPASRQEPPPTASQPTPRPETPTLPTPDDREAATTGSTIESAGPWGVLQSFPIFFAAPDVILDLVPLPSATTTWVFRDLASDEVADTLDRPGLPAHAAAELLDRSRWTTIGDETRVTPSDEVVRSLPPDVRAAIYAVLSRWEDNEFQHSPYFIPRGDVRRWLAGTDLPPRLVDTIARTAYRVGEATCFSDLPLLVSLTSSQAEARRLLKALSRTETFILRIRLDGPGDVAKIRDYWGAGEANAKDFGPLLDSVAVNSDIRYLDIVHLLPPFPRKLLYTFPQRSMGIGGRFPDCHWTTLNFFREQPEPRLADSAGATMHVLESLHLAEPPYDYGDVLLLANDEGDAIHSCIYLADDYVFTKNGSNILSPWLVMKLAEVSTRYSRHGPVTVKVYRK